jgi:CheY-like chemotaxis protein
MLMFEIKDTGRGISEEDAPKLFSAFQQVDMSKNRNVVGTGLGLVISKSFVEMMGGSITFESKYGQGTVFRVKIPLVIGDPEKVKHEKLESKSQSMFAPKANILVVDDNEFNLRVASGLLYLHKINAQTVDNGQEAIGLVQKNEYDIVFMDHMMPEMDGIETTARIRALGGKFKDMPIIALTANAIAGAREMFLANGFSSFISKPIDAHELDEILIEWLPPEKIEYTATAPALSASESQNIESNEEENFLSVLDSIPEINKKIGLSHVSGVESMYLESIEFFAGKIVLECSLMAEFLEAANIDGFAIKIHAMKSSLATIGAGRMAEVAAKLEEAAKAGNADYCKDIYPGLQNELLGLHGKLKVLFPDDDDTTDKTAGDEALLKECIQKALSAIEELRELLNYDYKEAVNSDLKTAIGLLKEFDLDGALEILNRI